MTMGRFPTLRTVALLVLLSIPIVTTDPGTPRAAVRRGDPVPKTPDVTLPGSPDDPLAGKRVSLGPPPPQAPAPAARIGAVAERLKIRLEAQRWGLEREAAQGLLSTAEAAADLGRMMQASGASFRIAWDPELGAVRFLAGRGLDAGAGSPISDPTAAAQAFLARHRALWRVTDTTAEFSPTRVEESREGFRAVRFRQQWNGVPIRGHDIVVRLDAAGRVMGLSGRYRPTPEGPFVAASLSAAEAERVALGAARRDDGVVESTEPVFFPRDDELRLAWRVVVAAGPAYRTEFYVDAARGEVLHAVTLIRDNGAATGHGTDLSGQVREMGLWLISPNYYPIDTRKAMFRPGEGSMPNDPRGAIIVVHANHGESSLYHITSPNPESWTGWANAVSAAWAASCTYDYFSDTFGRSSYDGAGRTIWAVVNLGTKYNNAFWNGSMICFGNGDGVVFSDLAGALDVVAHELTHAVNTYSANLEYEFQSGALSEHFSDVFGCLVEWEADPAHADWWMGEDVTTPGTPGDCLRNLEDPDAPNVYGGPYPSTMDEYQDLPMSQDNGGVHINNTIPSNAFVMAAKATSRAAMAQIWYRALTQYLTASSQFVDLRRAVIQAAADLYGESSAEQQAIATALDAVGILGEGGGGDDGDLPDNQGADFLAIADTDDDQLYRVPPDWSAAPAPISNNQVAPDGGGRPSFSDDGMWMAWVAADGHIYLARSNGAERVQLSDAPEWWSVALSADASHLAATTVYEDGQVYVFDLLDPDQSRAYTLTTQNDSGDQGHDLVVYADVLEFIVSGDEVIYDALNRATLGGQAIEYWDINRLRLGDGSCATVLPPLPRGESVGNPALAQNHDAIIVYDHVDAVGRVRIRARDLETGDEGLVTDNYSELGRPTFSGDDCQVYYQYPIDGRPPRPAVWRVTVDGVVGQGDDELWASECYWPVWFTVGARPTPVALLAFEATRIGFTVGLRWRVDDPAAFIGFEVERGAQRGGPFVRLTTEPIPTTLVDREGFFEWVDREPIEGGWYRLLGVGRDGRSEVLGLTPLGDLGARADLARPMLLASGPNPIVGATVLRFWLPPSAARQPVELLVYDAQGRRVAAPVAGEPLAAGEHRREWLARDASGARLPSGVYYARLRAGAQVRTLKLNLAR
jgi:Zn-dependent metalloprotease